MDKRNKVQAYGKKKAWQRQMWLRIHVVARIYRRPGLLPTRSFRHVLACSLSLFESYNLAGYFHLSSLHILKDIDFFRRRLIDL